jgi:glycosyltransferase involved in cell wall biosynthesis
MNVNVSIVTFPLVQAGQTPLSNLVRLLAKISNRVNLISGGQFLEKLRLDPNVHVVKITHRNNEKLLIMIINYLHTQLKILCGAIRMADDTDVFIFFIGGELLFIPLIVLKLLRKKVVLIPAMVTTAIYSVRRNPLSKFVSLLATINFFLADRIIIYSSALVQELNVKQGNKLVVAHEHFVDFRIFMVKNDINKRANAVGYIGRFSEEKGILNLVKSIPLFLKRRNDVCFKLCGEGKLFDKIKSIIRFECLESYVNLTGWVSHSDVPNFLNDIKLLVLPSYTECLPNIILEAMACGTPVLTTGVGAIPDVIRNSETGFLLESNDPSHITDKIVELLNKPRLLEKVSKNAYEWVRENFIEEKTLESWQRILQELELYT